jgi:peptidoglycan/LPS O-acetylase OafA/YrhL
MYQEIKYFQGLNALRFIAAYLVVLHHSERIKLKHDMFNLREFTLFNNGFLAVSFFFVLSGFLITYLLLKERKQTHKISIKSFYIRRILRIWPLYFLLVLIGTVLLPYALKIIGYPYEMPYEFSEVILYYIFFAPFMVRILYGHSILDPLWSIGVEEIFYIFWAPLFSLLKNHILKLIIGVICLKLLVVLMMEFHHFGWTTIQVIRRLKFEAMAVGGLGAYLVFHRKTPISNSLLFSIPVQIIFIGIIFIRLFAFQYLKEHSLVFEQLFTQYYLPDLLIFIIFAWLIVNVSINTKSLFTLHSKALHLLGDISYGIYMYHVLIIFGVVLIAKNILNSMDNIASTLIFYTVVTSGVIGLAYLSKRFFEDPFLRLKPRPKPLLDQSRN